MSERDVWRIRDLLAWTAEYFERHAIETARLDAEVLLAHSLEEQRLWLYMSLDEAVPEERLAAFRGCVKRRGAHEPVAYIVGEKEFFSLTFEVTPAVLVPRPETELLVQVAVDALREEAYRGELHIADVGTGSGIVAVTVAGELREPSSLLVATDVSEAALDVARRNAERHGVADRIEFRRGSGVEPLEAGEAYDAIVSNPPYVPTGQLSALSSDIMDHEPIGALDGGRDGLDVIREIVRDAAGCLVPGGLLALEVGDGQAAEVANLIEATGEFASRCLHRDFGGIERVVSAACLS